MERNSDIDEKSLLDKGIRQLLKAVDLAYEIFEDSEIDLKTRQGWFREHTSAVLALNQLLKDRLEMGTDDDAELEEYVRNIRRTNEQSEISATVSGRPGENLTRQT